MIHMTLQERKVVLFFSLLFAAGVALSVFKKTTGCNVCLIDLYSRNTVVPVLDINTASRDELIALPGIGEKGAEDLLTYRAQQGRINDLSELGKIKGFTAAKIEVLKKYLSVRR